MRLRFLSASLLTIALAQPMAAQQVGSGINVPVASGGGGSGGGAVGANPTATAGPAAVNGAAATFMRSDGAPAVQKGSSSVFGIVEVDNSTITATGGVISAASAVRAIGQSHIPFIMPSSGLMGNNGALTVTTALPLVYANSYVYMPAGAIAAASSAGWYYAVFSSTTVATLYNNTYSNYTTPAIPGSPTAFATTGPGAYVQTTGSNIAAYSNFIVANTIGINGTIESWGVISTNNSAGAKTFLVNYGAFNCAIIALTTSTTAAFIGGFSNRGATNVQIPLQNQSTFQPTTGSVALTQGSVDTTSSQGFIFYLKLAVATDFIVLENVVIKLVPGV